MFRIRFRFLVLIIKVPHPSEGSGTFFFAGNQKFYALFVSSLGNFSYLCDINATDMKSKFNTNTDSILGAKIQEVRKAKGWTQEELGKKIALSKSGISKIEHGLTHISVEDASVILAVMGEKLDVQVLGIQEPQERRERKSNFIASCIAWFAREFRLSFSKAYGYLLAHKVIAFLNDNFTYEQTLPRKQIVEDMRQVSINNGGALAV